MEIVVDADGQKNKLEFEKRVETHSAREKEKKKYRENKTKKNTFY